MIIIFSMVASALLASIVFLVITLIGKYHALADLRKLSGPRPSIFFGNAWQLPSNPEGMFKQVLQWADEHWKEGVFCLWLGPLYPYVLTFKQEFAEILLDSSKHLTKSNDYSYMIPWLGTGLLISEGSKWRTRRKLITPTFHFRILNDFLQVFEEQAAILVTRLENHVGKGVFNLMPFISLCTLDIICSLSPSDSFDEALADMIHDGVNDLRNDLAKGHFEKDETKKKELMTKFFLTTLPERLGKFEAIVKSREEGKSFFFGDKLTYADISLVAFVNGVKVSIDNQKAKGNPTPDIDEIIGKCPLLVAYINRVLAVPEIKTWVEKRPDSEF